MSTIKFGQRIMQRVDKGLRAYVESNILPDLQQECQEILMGMAAHTVPDADYFDRVIPGISLDSTEHGITLNTEGLADTFLHGTGPWDMKPGLLSGPNARFSMRTGNKYNVIPIGKSGPRIKRSDIARHRSEGTGRSSVSPSGMVGPEKSFVAETLLGTYGEEAISLRKRMSTRAFQGFRTVSSQSSPSSWIHPGNEERDFETPLQGYIEAKLATRIEDYQNTLAEQEKANSILHRTKEQLMRFFSLRRPR